MIDDQIHRHGPSGLTDAEHDQLRSRLLAEVRTDRSPRRPRAGRARRAVVASAVAAVAATASVAAAYVTFVRPDPAQVATITDHAQVVADVHGPGWRPELDAELVECRPAAGDGFEAYASTHPLGDVLEADHLTEACRQTSAALGVASGPAATTCRAADADFPRPIVLIDGRGCPEAGLRPFERDDLRILNRARATEVAVLAIDDPCPDRRAVLDWTARQLDQAGSDLAVVDARAPGAPPAVCFGTYLDWTAGTATVDIASAKEHP